MLQSQPVPLRYGQRVADKTGDPGSEDGTVQIWLVLLFTLAWQPGTMAQSADTASPAERFSTEWGFTTGGATDLPGGARGGEFWAMQLRWGKVLTAPYGPGVLRGTLEYAFEIVPAIVLRQTCAAWSFTSITDFLSGKSTTFGGCDSSKGATLLAISRPANVYGGGINPFFWQYNFTSHPRVVPYIQLGGGMLFTTQDFPAGTSSFNFTPQGGIGAYWFQRPRRAVNFGVRYNHISNAGITKPNPGHNALYFYGGLSWWR